MNATISDAPQEILSQIFEKLEIADLKNCQKVCKSWYIPAHVLMLEEISLDCPTQLMDFIMAIDLNPHPLYLKAVKRMYIEDLDKYDIDFKLDEDTIRSLLFRFPNLEEAQFNDCRILLTHFDDKLCTDLIESCPRLDSFVVLPFNYATARHYEWIWKLRHLVSYMDIDTIAFPRRPGDGYQYLISFPRLREITDVRCLDSVFRKYLPLLEQLPRLTKLSVKSFADDEPSFVDTYLASKTNDERNQLLQRLSSIASLEWDSSLGICANSLKFIPEYLTGLNSLEVKTELPKDANDDLLQTCFDTVSNIMHSVNACRLNIKMNYLDVPIYLPTVMKNLYDNRQTSTPNNVTGIALQLKIESLKSLFESTAEVSVNTDKRQGNRFIEITVNSNLTLSEILEQLFSTVAPLDGIDKFSLLHDGRLSATDTTYDVIFQWFPSLTELEFDMHPPLKDLSSIKRDLEHEKYPMVHTLTIRASKDAEIQDFLNRCSLSFPNLEYLELSCICNNWEEEDFGKIELTRYSLTKLTMHWKKDSTTSSVKKVDFYVIKISILSIGEDIFYKLFTNDTTPISYMTSNEDLEGLVPGKDYICVHITINSLIFIELYYSESERVHDPVI